MHHSLVVGFPVLLNHNQIEEGLAKVLVIAVGEDSQYGILFKNLQTENEPTPLEEKLDNLATCNAPDQFSYIVLTRLLFVLGIGWGGMAAAVMIFCVLLIFYLVDHYTGTDTKPHCFLIDFSGLQQTICWYKEQDRTWTPEALSSITGFAIIAITIVVVAVPEGENSCFSF